jgi:DNA repair protein SbcC/Rad50
MQITHLYLQNYRVFEEPVDLDIPPGLVGVYGLNGAGKSTLLESVRFALFGRARTSLDQVRTSGVKAECIAEVEFEHEGHLYVVRRSISGSGATVKAQAHADRLQVAEGARDTARYVHSVLGMDDAAFRASVFAEQKQLAALSQQRPEERRKLVLQLLGITPVDSARDRARTQGREATATVERLRSLLPDLATLEQEATARSAEAEAAGAEAVAAGRHAEELAEAAAQAEAEHERLDALRHEHDRVAAEASAVRAEHDRGSLRAEKAAAALDELERHAGELTRLEPVAAGLAAVEARVNALQAVAGAAEAVAAVVVPPEPEPADEEGEQQARAAADAAGQALAGVEGLLRAAEEEHQRAKAAVERSSRLSGEAGCPLCGQALGGAFEQVQAHRAAELAEVGSRRRALAARQAQLSAAAQQASAQATARAVALRRSRAEWATFEKAQARRAQAEQALERARQACGDAVPDPAALPALADELRKRRQAYERVLWLRSRIERRAELEAELAAERLSVDACAGRLSTLGEKLAALGFVPEALAAARATRERLRAELTAAQRAAQQAAMRAAQAATAAAAAAQRLTDAEAQHAQLAVQVEDARHLQRLGELLHSFRNTLVASAGPRLSAQAANLFAELTDHEYDDLQVDPETYEIRVSDQGQAYGMDRFSGSETDLANLALRVAISEHVQFQSGGMVGLLVLDEVFGPLDDERKDRMLAALERLRSRFRQVLVVTHDSAIKEQLPHAIEVVKRPNRRAAVRLVTGR